MRVRYETIETTESRIHIEPVGPGAGGSNAPITIRDGDRLQFRGRGNPFFEAGCFYQFNGAYDGDRFMFEALDPAARDVAVNEAVIRDAMRKARFKIPVRA